MQIGWVVGHRPEGSPSSAVLPRVLPPSKTHVEKVKPFAASGIHINGRQSP